jgi:hypothetical protein
MRLDDDEIEAALRQRVKDDPKWVMSVIAAASNEKLIAAAKRVVDTRYSKAGWDDLNEAIGSLGDLLKSQGVQCNGIN